MESFLKNLSAIGVPASDIQILEKVVHKFPHFNIFQVLNTKSTCRRSIYHQEGLSQPFKMLLRLVVGISLFRGLDKPHRNAIFYVFEHRSKRDKSDIRQLEDFWSLSRRFFANPRLSAPIYDIIKREMSEGESELINTLNEFNIPYSYTRSHKRHLPTASTDLSYKRCLARKLRRERAEVIKAKQVQYVRHRMHQWSNQVRNEHEQFKTGSYHGRCDGDYDGNNDGLYDASHELRRVYRYKMRRISDKSDYYRIGYKMGYAMAYDSSYDHQYNQQGEPDKVFRRLSFEE